VVKAINRRCIWTHRFGAAGAMLAVRDRLEGGALVGLLAIAA